MEVPDTSPKNRKFTNEQLAKVFEQDYRKRVGKIELSAGEITEILNEEILDNGTTVTRQAVDKRLNELVGTQFEGLDGKLLRSQHGRSYLYYRDTDMERVFADGGMNSQLFEDSPMKIRFFNISLIMILYGISALLFYFGFTSPDLIFLILSVLAAIFASVGLGLYYSDSHGQGSNRAWKLGEHAYIWIKSIRGEG